MKNRGRGVQLLLTRNPKNDFYSACPDPVGEEHGYFSLPHSELTADNKKEAPRFSPGRLSCFRGWRKTYGFGCACGCVFALCFL